MGMPRKFINSELWAKLFTCRPTYGTHVLAPYRLHLLGLKSTPSWKQMETRLETHPFPRKTRILACDYIELDKRLTLPGLGKETQWCDPALKAVSQRCPSWEGLRKSCPQWLAADWRVKKAALFYLQSQNQEPSWVTVRLIIVTSANLRPFHQRGRGEMIPESPPGRVSLIHSGLRPCVLFGQDWHPCLSISMGLCLGAWSQGHWRECRKQAKNQKQQQQKPTKNQNPLNV